MRSRTVRKIHFAPREIENAQLFSRRNAASFFANATANALSDNNG
jgi:hypothetical protein